MSLNNPSCMQRGPKWSAARTPFHATTRCGGFQRSDPVGGAAYGMPRNSSSPFAASRRPAREPLSMRTVGVEAGAGAAMRGITNSIKTNPDNMRAAAENMTLSFLIVREAQLPFRHSGPQLHRRPDPESSTFPNLGAKALDSGFRSQTTRAAPE